MPVRWTQHTWSTAHWGANRISKNYQRFAYRPAEGEPASLIVMRRQIRAHSFHSEWPPVYSVQISPFHSLIGPPNQDLCPIALRCKRTGARSSEPCFIASIQHTGIFEPCRSLCHEHMDIRRASTPSSHTLHIPSPELLLTEIFDETIPVLGHQKPTPTCRQTVSLYSTTLKILSVLLRLGEFLVPEMAGWLKISPGSAPRRVAVLPIILANCFGGRLDGLCGIGGRKRRIPL